jgi:hypothetical protein
MVVLHAQLVAQPTNHRKGFAVAGAYGLTIRVWTPRTSASADW